MYPYEITYVVQMNFCAIGSIDAATIVRNVTSQDPKLNTGKD